MKTIIMISFTFLSLIINQEVSAKENQVQLQFHNLKFIPAPEKDAELVLLFENSINLQNLEEIEMEQEEATETIEPFCTNTAVKPSVKLPLTGLIRIEVESEI